MSAYIQVALPVPLFKTFTYGVPEEFQGISLIGMRVSVPFGKRTLTGIVVAESDVTELEKVKPLSDLLDRSPLFTGEMLRFAEWMSTYYISPLGETLRAMLPQGMTPESTQRVALADSGVISVIPDLRRSAPRQAAILRALADHPNGVAISFLQKKIGAEHLHTQLAMLESRGLVVRSIEQGRGTAPKKVKGVRIVPELLLNGDDLHALFDRLDRAAPKQAALMALLYTEAERHGHVFLYAAEILARAKAPSSALKALEERGAVETREVEVSREEVLTEEESAVRTTESGPAIIPNPDQRVAIQAIESAIDAGTFKTFLLHGVTGSGKTQVYIEAIRHVMSRGKRGIMLVPEIALTLQLVERFTDAFGDRVVVLHSRMSDGERYDGWRRAASGGADVVIGARSALFAPLRDVGIVIVDEEHEGSYKQYDAQPRYNARDAAIVRAQIAGAVAVLGSATPSVESYYNAERGKYTLLRLPERVDNAKEPSMLVVDTNQARNMRLMRGSLSVRLISDIKDRIAKGEGVILFLNRRGFATRLECQVCAHTPMCPNCAVTLTYHKRRDELCCHYCGYSRRAETQCQVCGSLELRQPGIGTEKVEEEIVEHIPNAKVVRMDLDTTSRKGAHRKILGSFASGEVDILLGTQMVAKGLDFSRVSLVGVISADTQLLLPDFRASERTFQLLTQVSGRAGRRNAVEGEVVIQTAHPNHPAIQASFSKDYLMMYHEELRMRQELKYPPFSRFIVVEFRSTDQAEADRHARTFRKLLPAEHPSMEILGPTSALIWKLRNLYRYQIVIKNIKASDPGGKLFGRIFSYAYETYQEKHARTSVQIIVDVDAQGMV